jgi:hypothetical protein
VSRDGCRPVSPYEISNKIARSRRQIKPSNVTIWLSGCRATGAGGASRGLWSVVESFYLVRAIDWPTDYLNARSYLLFRRQPVPGQYGLLQCGAISRYALSKPKAKQAPRLRILRTFGLNRRCEAMRLIALTVALVPLTSAAVAQGVTQGDQSIRPTEGQSSPSSSQGPTTGVICREEISATFCNVVGSPSNGGFGSTSGAQGTVGSSADPTPTPPCGNFWPPAEQCD